MYKNLVKELGNKHIMLKAVAELIGCTPQSLNNKLYGTTDFTLTEGLLIIDNLLPEFELHYLFKKEEQEQTA